LKNTLSFTVIEVIMMLSEKRNNMLQAAKLYYYGSMSQDEIAKLLHISRPKVSRLLSEARQLNIVKITITDPNQSFQNYEEILCSHFGLKHAIIVPGGPNEEAIKRNVGQAASEFLNSHLTGDMKIGISWGTTLAAFVKEFQTKTPVPDVRIVQLIGGTYSQTLNIDGRDLVRTMAQKLQCEYSILQAPLIVTKPILRQLLMEEPNVIRHFEHIRSLDIAFVGIGHSYFSYKDSIVYRANYIAEAEAPRLEEMELVCDICGHPLLQDGTEPETFLQDRIIGISLEELHRIPLVVGVCTGHSKVKPVLAALRGRHINTLITDEVAAITLLTEENLI